MTETKDYKNSTIMGLIRGHTDLKKYDDVIKRNSLIHKNFNIRYNYPLLIFHEGNINESHQKYIIDKSEGGENIKFINISEVWILPGTGGEARTHPRYGGFGFNKMCRFYSYEIYKYLEGYDYAMRLDDDSFIESEINYDIFEDMHKNGYDYGYIRRKIDWHKKTIDTFGKFCKNYLKKNVNPGNNFYNNFHISRVNFWNNPEIKEFFNAIEKTGNIRTCRWGDSCIQAACVKFWSTREKIKEYSDFIYTHGSHYYTNRVDTQHDWEW